MVNLSTALPGENYIALITFRKNGTAVSTPVWFAEFSGRLYVMTRGDSFKTRRIRNNSRVCLAACSIRGRVTGPEISATAKILPESEWPAARRLLEKKYLLMRLPFWSKKNVFVEISAAEGTH